MNCDNKQSHRTMFICVHAKSLQSCPALCDPMDCSPPVSTSMGFSWQKYLSGLPFLSLGDLSDSGIKPVSLMSSALAGRFFTTSTTNLYCCIIYISYKCHRDRLGPEAWGPLLQCLHLDKLRQKFHAPHLSSWNLSPVGRYSRLRTGASLVVHWLRFHTSQCLGPELDPWSRN